MLFNLELFQFQIFVKENVNGLMWQKDGDL